MGSVRSLSTSTMVFGTSLGPAIVGMLLDFGHNYNSILLGMCILAILASISLAVTMKHAPKLLSNNIKKELNMLNIYLSGEIHTDWREEIINLCKKENLDVSFSSPITNHDASDNCGVAILGDEESKFWKDHKGANINSIRTRKSIKDCDVVVVKFGEKYKQWNAAFDAGYAAALNKSIIVIHNDDHQHALKEVDAAACAVAKDQHQVVKILKYVLEGTLN